MRRPHHNPEVPPAPVGLSFNPDAVAVERAVQKYGLTDNEWDAGYVLPDGQLLNLRRKGNQWWQHAKRIPGFVEHADAAADALGVKPGSMSGIMREFARRTGAIRFSKHRFHLGQPAEMGLDIAHPATEAQRRRIREAFEPGMDLVISVYSPTSMVIPSYEKFRREAGERDLALELTKASNIAAGLAWGPQSNPPPHRQTKGPAMGKRAKIGLQGARRVGDAIGVDWNRFDLAQFRTGMNVEFEHGAQDPQTDVTGSDPILTGKIALAHLKEFPDYYERLERMERDAKGHVRSNPCPVCRRAVRYRTGADRATCPACRTVLGIRD